MSICESTLGVDAKLSFLQSTVNAVLSIIKLTNGSRLAAGCSQMETAIVAPANEGIGTGSKGRNGSEVLHIKISE